VTGAEVIVVMMYMLVNPQRKPDFSILGYTDK